MAASKNLNNIGRRQVTTFTGSIDKKAAIVDETGCPGMAVCSTLTCTCSSYLVTPVNRIPFCVHIREVYDKALDARDSNKHPIPLPPFVEVVIFQGKPPTVAEIGLDPPNAEDLQKAFVIAHHVTEDSYGQHFIGFLAPGGGRKVLRSMVLDMLTGSTKDDIEKYPCRNQGHWTTDKYTWGFNPKDREHLADLLYRIQYGECHTCATNSAVPEI